MKTDFIKRFTGLVLAVGIVGACILGVQASNYTNSTLTSFEISSSVFTPLPYARNKTDDSSLYLNITDMNYTYALVQARGANVAYGITLSNTTNETYSLTKGSCEYVTCWKNHEYSVHSLIYEDNYSYATLAFHAGYAANDHVTGVWSPDSIGTYTDAN